MAILEQRNHHCGFWRKALGPNQRGRGTALGPHCPAARPDTYRTSGMSSLKLLSSSGVSLWKKEYRSRRFSSQPPTTEVTACRTCHKRTEKL